MTRQAKTVFCSMLILYTTLASAHHAFAPVYDGSRTVTVAGVVTSFRLVNLHVQMAVDVRDDSGKVTSNPTHTASPRMFFLSLQREDGSSLRRPAIDRIQSLEQRRRQRIEQRE